MLTNILKNVISQLHVDYLMFFLFQEMFFNFYARDV